MKKMTRKRKFIPERPGVAIEGTLLTMNLRLVKLTMICQIMKKEELEKDYANKETNRIKHCYQVMMSQLQVRSMTMMRKSFLLVEADPRDLKVDNRPLETRDRAIETKGKAQE
jgi:hypothetical protein